MATKFEEQFFKCFGIEPIQLNKCSYVNLRNLGLEYGTDICLHIEDETITCDNCKNNRDGELLYPPITDTILLDLICILNIRITAYDAEYRWCKNRAKLKDVILRDCIYNKELIQTEVRKLFEVK